MPLTALAATAAIVALLALILASIAIAWTAKCYRTLHVAGALATEALYTVNPDRFTTPGGTNA